MPRPSHMYQQSLVWCFCDINTGREVNFCHTWSEIWMHTKVFVDIHLYADEEVVLTARINRIKCTHTYKCYTAKSINLLWNIPLSNGSSAAMNLFIKWNFCSSSCKINATQQVDAYVARLTFPRARKIGAGCACADGARAWYTGMAGKCMLFPFLLKSVPTSMLVHVLSSVVHNSNRTSESILVHV